MRFRRLRLRRRLRLGLLLLLLGLVLLLYLRYIPTVRRLVAMQADNETSNLVNAAVGAYLAEERLTYEDLVRLEKNDAGAVTAMHIDMDRANRLRAHVLEQVDRRIPDLDSEDFSVPVGSVIFPALLSGRGGSLPVRVVSLRSANAEFKSSFTQAGINQTLHSLDLEVEVEILLLTPAGFLDLNVNTCVPVAQTVIVGAVPNALISTGD